jgi:AraC-like DNA-binding protein
MEIADALKKELRELGLSRAWLAQACGCSLSTINHALASGGNKRARQRIVAAMQLEQKRRKLQVLAKVAEEIIQAAKDEQANNNQPTQENGN